MFLIMAIMLLIRYVPMDSGVTGNVVLSGQPENILNTTTDQTKNNDSSQDISSDNLSGALSNNLSDTSSSDNLSGSVSDSDGVVLNVSDNLTNNIVELENLTTNTNLTANYSSVVTIKNKRGEVLSLQKQAAYSQALNKDDFLMEDGTNIVINGVVPDDKIKEIYVDSQSQSQLQDNRITTKIVAATTFNFDYARITIPKTGKVTRIMRCENFNIQNFECYQWTLTNIKFEENSNYITFTVNQFSAYAGGDIEILNVQSYPNVGGKWTVKFTVNGSDNLTITPINETTFGDNGDLEFLEIKCNDYVVPSEFNGESVLIQDYECQGESLEISKVLTSGKHTIEFRFGNDVKYAFNEADNLSVSINLNPSIIEAGKYVGVYGNASFLNGTTASDSRVLIYINQTLLKLSNLTFNNIFLKSNFTYNNMSEFQKWNTTQLTIDSNGFILSKSSDYNWAKKTLVTSPSGRRHHSMVYDSNNKLSILYGGEILGYSRSSETWVYNSSANTWTNKNPSNPPTGRSSHAMVYDENSKLIVLYGGQISAGSAVQQDTWTYNYSANAWTNKNPATSPGLRMDASMAYDKNKKVIVFFGGASSTGLMNDTWIYNTSSNVWTNISPISSPSPRKWASMVFDQNINQIVLFGGQISAGVSNELWTYNFSSNNWTQINQSLKPVARVRSGMVFDSEIDVLLLFGGGSDANYEWLYLLNDSWNYYYSTNSWVQKNTTTAPPSRKSAGFTYDVNSDFAVLFGGEGVGTGNYLNDTYVYDNTYFNSDGFGIITYDALTQVKFTNLSWTQNTNSNNNITLQVRVSSDNETWSSWTTPIYGNSSFVSSQLNIASGRYLQIRVNLTTTNAESTPRLYNLTIHAVTTTNSAGQYNYSIRAPLIVGEELIRVGVNTTNFYGETNQTLTITPNIEFSTATPADMSYLSSNTLNISVDVAVTAFSNITYRLYNSSGLINETIFFTPTYSISYAGLDSAEKEYFYNATIKDATGFQKTTETRTVVLDTTYPSVSQALSSDNVDMNFEQLSIIATSSDKYLGVITVNVTQPDNTCILYTSSNNFTANFTPTQPGLHTVKTSSQDLALNTNTTSTLHFTAKSFTTGSFSSSPGDFNILNTSAEYPYTFTISFNLTNIGNSSMYNPNVSLIFSGLNWASNYTNNTFYCQNNTPSNTCRGDMLVTFPASAPSDVYTVNIIVRWTNPNMTLSQLSNPLVINVFDVVEIKVSNQTISKTVQHGTQANTTFFQINSTGNTFTDTIYYNISGGNLNVTWVNFTPQSGTFLLFSGGQKNVTPIITVPTGADPGNYTTNISVFMGSTLKQTIPLNIEVPPGYTWTVYDGLPNTLLEPGVFGVLLGSIILNNTGNVQQQFFSIDNSTIIGITPSGFQNVSKQEILNLSVLANVPENQEPGYYSYKITIYTVENSSNQQILVKYYDLMNRPPIVTNVNTSFANPEINRVLRISASINDLHGVSSAWINLTAPNAAKQRINMTFNGSKYYADVTPTQQGTYYYTISSNDTKSIQNTTANYNFTTVSKVTSTLTLSQNTTVVAGITQNDNNSFILTLNSSNNDVATAYNAAINVTIPTGWTVSPNNTIIGSLNYSTSNTTMFSIYVPKGTLAGNYTLYFNLSWTNPDDTKSASVKSFIAQISSNRIMNMSNESSIIIQHNTTYSYPLLIQNIGNDVLRNFSLTCISGSCSNFTIAYNQTGFNISAGANATTIVNITTPFGFSPGEYNFTINASSDDQETMYFNITVPQNTTWVRVPSNISLAVGANYKSTLGPINITSTANLNITILGVSSNNSIVSLNQTTINLVFGETKRVLLNYTAPTQPNNYTVYINFTNSTLETPFLTTNVSFQVLNYSVNLTMVNYSNNSGVATNEILTLQAVALYNGLPLINNISFQAYIDDSLCNITFNNYSTFWELNCTAPNVSDGRYHNVTLIGTFENYSAVYESTLYDSLFYRDVTAPIFVQTNQTNVLAGQNNNLVVNITDNVNISRVWAEVIHPNKTSQNISLSESAGLYTFTLENLSLGDYDVLIFTNDTSGNLRNTTTWFESYTPINFSSRVKDPLNLGVDATFEFYRPNTTTLLYNVTQNNVAGYNVTTGAIHKRKYDLVIKNQVVNIFLRNVSIDENSSDIIDFYTLGSTKVLDLSSSYVPLIGIAARTNLSNKGNITLNYSGLSVGNKNNVYIFRCSNWTYTAAANTCNEAWSLLSNVTRNLIANTVTAEIEGFSAYVASEFIPPTSSGGGGGGGGTGGGGGGGGGSLEVKEPEKESPGLFPQKLISVNPKSLHKKLYPGEKSEDIINIENDWNESLGLELIVAGNISKYLFVENKLTLLPSSYSLVLTNFSIPIDIASKDVSGEIRISSENKSLNVSVSIPVFLNILEKTRTYKLEVNPSKPGYNLGEEIFFDINIISLGIEKGIYGHLNYSIVDTKNDDVMFQGFEEIISVNPSITILRKVEVDNLIEGEYLIDSIFFYNDNERELNSTSKKTFIVTKSLWGQFLVILRMKYYGVSVFRALLGLLGIIVLFIFYRVYKTIKYKLSKYKVVIKYSKLPKKGKRSAWIGKLADSHRKAYMELDKLQMHTLIAGSTGSGKTFAAQVVIEEALQKEVAVLIFDPTAQWTGFLQQCKEQIVLDHYADFGMSNKSAKAFNGNIRQINDPNEEIDVEKFIRSGEINVITMTKLKASDIEQVVANTIESVFKAGLEETKNLKLLLIYDEVHRLLPKFGGKGEGLKQIERAAREFRKWGVGLVLISQVLGDFVEEIKANINTSIQMKTKHEGDLNRIEKLFGIDIFRSINSASIGVGLIQNAEFNEGRPYFVNFRPVMHSIKRLDDKTIAEYNKYNRMLDELEDQLKQFKERGVDVFDLEIELKLSLEKIKTGEFNLVRIYIESLKTKLDHLSKKAKYKLIKKKLAAKNKKKNKKKNKDEKQPGNKKPKSKKTKEDEENVENKET